MKEHIIGKKGANFAVHNALLKYDDWEVGILHTCQSRDDANRIEIEEIRNFDCVTPGGYNLTHGGSAESPLEETRRKISKSRTGFKHSDESKAKMSESHTGKHFTDETRAKMSDSRKGEKNPRYGKHHTDESRAKMSASQMGKHLTDETRAKIAAASKDRRHTDRTKAAISFANSGEKNGMFGHKRTAESRAKQRRTCLKTAFKKKMKEFRKLREMLFEQGINIDAILEDVQ